MISVYLLRYAAHNSADIVVELIWLGRMTLSEFISMHLATTIESELQCIQHAGSHKGNQNIFKSPVHALNN